MDKKELSIWVKAILCVPKVGRKTAWKIFENLPEDISNRDEFIRFVEKASEGIPRMPNLTEEGILEMLEKAEGIIEQTCSVNRGSVLNYSEFPNSLRMMDDPPLLLHCLGNTSLIGMPGTAVIGTREPTSYGEKAAHQFGGILTQHNQVVVSGLALGCDTGGHLGCLNKNGKTIAVLAHGLDSIYPSQNRDLAKRILSANGLLVSEYSFGTSVRAPYFVERDRLQAGLSNQVIVVETGIKGGTLHTVGFAEKNGIPVFALDHPEELQSNKQVLGNRMLLKEERAQPLTPNFDDIEKIIQREEKVDLESTETEKGISSGPVETKKLSRESFFKI
jgi:DNA processing protein